MVDEAKKAQANVEEKLKHSNQTVDAFACFFASSMIYDDSIVVDRCIDCGKYSIEKNCQ